MEFLAIFGALLIGLAAGVALGWLAARLAARGQGQQAGQQLAQADALLRQRDETLAKLEAERDRLQAENRQLLVQVAELRTARQADADKLQWLDQAQARLREAFAALAGESLQTNADAFITRAREQVEALLGQVRGDWGAQKAEFAGLVDPLQRSLGALDQHVRDLEQKREGAYQRVDEQLRGLMLANGALQSATTTLAQALKSSAVRGRWGELQLRRVVEMSGMHEHISFEEQAVVEEGRPDMIVYLPGGAVIPVDSKAPMEAYLSAIEAGDDRARHDKMGEHARAMQSRVRDLGQKRYWAQFDQSPDFVVMFVPSESCLSAAFGVDPQLMEYAMQHNVMLASPITLLALLKAVAYGWQQHRMNENARQIAEVGQQFHERLQVFVDHLNDMSKALNKAVQEHNDVVGSFERRLLPSVRRLEGLVGAAQELAPPPVVDLSARAVTPEDA